MPLIRLDRFISERTEYTRSTIKELAKKGRISVDGITEKSADRKIDPENVSVTVEGRLLSAQKYRYILLNKPEGYVCSTDEKDGETVMKLVPDEWRTKNMFPAGRLDKDSLGALIITDDGGLAHKMLSPASHVPKIYIVKLDRPFKIKYIDIFKNGLELASGELCLPAKVRPVENCDKLAFIELHEGKYHQIKRMFKTVENSVEKLARVSVGGLILPEKLAIGQCMELLHKDVENLFTPPDFDLVCEKFSGFFSANLINK
jgi:16S rRNA pseudouridine516 synthase